MCTGAALLLFVVVLFSGSLAWGQSPLGTYGFCFIRSAASETLGLSEYVSRSGHCAAPGLGDMLLGGVKDMLADQGLLGFKIELGPRSRDAESLGVDPVRPSFLLKVSTKRILVGMGFVW